MNQSKDNLNEEWREIFDKASETPPPNIWASIEKHLDEQNRVPVVVPFWKSSQAWVAAASALLVLGIGAILFLQRTPNHTPDEQVTLHQAPATTTPDHIATAPQPAEEGPVVADNPTKKTITEKQGAANAGDVSPSRPAARATGNSQVFAGVTEKFAPGKNEAQQLAKAGSRLAEPVSRIAEKDEKTEISGTRSLEPLDPLQFEELKTYWQTRYVFFNPDARHTEEPAMPKAESSQLWAGLAVMPGGFNPNMEFQHQSVYQMNNIVGTHNYTTSNQLSYSNRNETESRDQAKISYQATAQVGLSLSKNWSLESGIAYLQGNSTSRSPGFIMDRITQERADLLPNAMASGSAHYSNETVERLQLQSDAKNAAMYVPIDKNVGNNFSYLQVPAYLGYTFRPEKKFSYTILAGGVTNFFLENRLETTSGYTLKTTPENNVYNDLNISAAAGLRINYRMSKDWNTNLTANYQRALMNNFQDNLFLKSFPTVYGLSWGVRYSF
ncbi:hypothetical protein GCM10023091_15920 [Ravibacter arvi]|uniref:Outer membrane protein beta-barrel domain-containing protein n=1 Tax=Ravibacter arvi TaxID=2051041 RepID=A0ABP8LVY2_9BACT